MDSESRDTKENDSKSLGNKEMDSESLDSKDMNSESLLNTEMDSESLGNGEMDSVSLDTIRINVGGVLFKCYKHTLGTFDESVLAQLDKSAANFDPLTQEFFFDRNPQLFNYILDAYRAGTVHIPKDTCGITFKAEMEFWGISTQYVSPCCWGALYSADEYMKTVATLEEFYRGSTGLSIMRGDKISKREKIWLFLYEPKSSIYAALWAVFISLLIVVSVLVSAVESLPFVYTNNYTDSEMHAIVKLYHMLGFQNSSFVTDVFYKKVHIAIPMTDTVCFAILTIDLILCFIFCPSRRKLLKSWIHIAEIICSISYWMSFTVDLCLGQIESTVLLAIFISLKYLTVLKLVRLLRVARNIPALKIMGLTLNVSKAELSVIGLMLFMFSSFFGMMIYLVDMHVKDQQFENVFIAMYWAVITLTTVGYGDYTPTSVSGHVIAGACAVCGILMLAIPIGIIASEYMNYYDYHKYAKYYIRDNVSGMVAKKRINDTELAETEKRKRLFFYNKKLHTN